MPLFAGPHHHPHHDDDDNDDDDDDDAEYEDEEDDPNHCDVQAQFNACQIKTMEDGQMMMVIMIDVQAQLDVRCKHTEHGESFAPASL